MLRIFACLTATVVMVQSAEWYQEMKIGPAWSNTFEDTFQGTKRVAALKGILLDLGKGQRALFDTETLRLVTAYSGDVNWAGTPWMGNHGPLISLQNDKQLFNTAAFSGWADPTGSFEDKRDIPGFGNLKHASFLGYYRHGDQIVFHYTVNGADVLEAITREGSGITRSFQVSNSTQDLLLSIVDDQEIFTMDGDSAKSVEGLHLTTTGGALLLPDSKNAGRVRAKFPKNKEPQVFQITYSKGTPTQSEVKLDFKALTSGGPALYPEILETKGKISTDKNSAYATDILTLPKQNPWGANLRFGGFDFIDENSAALSTWNGDVWVVRGLAGDWNQLKWQRIASGLFETLGLKVVNGIIHVHGRDQITQLIDLNADGETDHFKTFNRDVIISSNFHEFAFDLQTDKAGNFYFSKASPVRGGGRGFDQILPHHGIVAKISPDGKKFEVVATGLRAPGGLGIGPNGEITTGENEGTNQPCCKVNYTAGHQPVFFGTEASRQSLKEAPFTEPLCYLPMAVDNSSGSQVWVPEGIDFGLAAGTLLHLSYGQSSIYQVLTIPRGQAMQGGVVKLPIKLQSSAMRARFHQDGSMYVLGFRGWQTNAATECAFQRVRHNPNITVLTPEKLEYTSTGILLKFPVKLSAELAEDIASYSAERWNYIRGPQYGSGEFSVDQPDLEAEKQALETESRKHRKRDTVEIQSAKLLPDGQTVELMLAGMKPAMTLRVTYDVEDKNANVIAGELNATVYAK